MKRLNRKLFEENFAFPADVAVGTKRRLPERVLQFGEGNFLRAFVDSMLDELNENGLLNGSITVVQPIENGLAYMLNEQDGLYTLFLRGLENGQEVCRKRVVTSVQEAINPYNDFANYYARAKNPDLRFIVSNTTEAGIAYATGECLTDTPQNSFPGKVTAFLYTRFLHFNGDKSKGLVFIPCELIDYNGDNLKKIVLRHAEEWALGADFITWVSEANVFTNTLVDRIVTGYPRDEAAALAEALGYEDKLLDTGEIFHFWVIEGPKALREELPFDKLGLNVIFTDNATPYKLRKVRILNGAHTCSVTAGFLCGHNTVGEMVADPMFKAYLEKALFDEVIPTLDLEYDNLKAFADAVFDRFANPFIKHQLLSITLNSVSKWKARVLPSVTEYVKRKSGLPKLLTFSLAALLAFDRGAGIVEGALIGSRAGEAYKVMDDAANLEMLRDLWAACDGSKSSVAALVQGVCGRADVWNMDLNTIPGFTDAVAAALSGILENGMKAAVEAVIA